MDTIGTEESVLIREGSLFQGLNYYMFGKRKGVLIREVSLLQGCQRGSTVCLCCV